MSKARIGLVLAAALSVTGCVSAPAIDSYGPAPNITLSQIADKIGGIEPGTEPLKYVSIKPAYQTGIVQPISWRGYVIAGDITPKGGRPSYYYVLVSNDRVDKVYKINNDHVYRLRYADGQRVRDLPSHYRVPYCYGANGCYVPEDYLEYRQ